MLPQLRRRGSLMFQLFQSPNRTTTVTIKAFEFLLENERDLVLAKLSDISSTSPLYPLLVSLLNHEPYKELLEALAESDDEEEQIVFYTLIHDCLNTIQSKK